MGTKIKISKSAQAKMEREARKKAKELAKESRDRLEEKYNEIINSYYAEYTPHIYIRNVKRGGTPGLEKTYRTKFEKKDDSFKGGIIISTDDMYPGGLRGKEVYTLAGYRGTQEQVLWSFLLGYHGLLHQNIVHQNIVDSGENFRYTLLNSPLDKEFQHDTWSMDNEIIYGQTKPLKEMREFFNELVQEMKEKV